ncbi:MAG: purine-nucleoside phosphorylase [Oscillospiraceae bacterium]|jgi:purine-nucleoside phosphorylase|nr:purine-nucleoside phosphorylase [Oscillospiraceae bacterium]
MTMHNSAKPGDIASHVIIGGDPERVTHMAQTYLKDAVLVSDVRGMVCYTGTYGGERISVMATGMGVPSMLIYATELFRDYDCEAIIRVGTSGGYVPDMERNDIVLAQAACHTSAINEGLFGGGTFCPIADYRLLRQADDQAKRLGQKVYIGNTVCNDRYYRLPQAYPAQAWIDNGILCSEMEGAALYSAAAQFHKRALMMVSILSRIACDPSGKEQVTRLPEREGHSIDDAILLAFETALADIREGKHGTV